MMPSQPPVCSSLNTPKPTPTLGKEEISELTFSRPSFSSATYRLHNKRGKCPHTHTHVSNVGTAEEFGFRLDSTLGESTTIPAAVVPAGTQFRIKFVSFSELEMAASLLPDIGFFLYFPRSFHQDQNHTLTNHSQQTETPAMSVTLAPKNSRDICHYVLMCVCIYNLPSPKNIINLDP